MSTTSGALGRERSGSANTVLFVLLGLLFLFAIVDFGFLYWKNNQDRQAISYTTQIQVLSQALAKYASEGVEVFLVTATRGDGGRYRGHRPDDPEHPGREALGKIRETELRAAEFQQGSA